MPRSLNGLKIQNVEYAVYDIASQVTVTNLPNNRRIPDIGAAHTAIKAKPLAAFMP